MKKGLNKANFVESTAIAHKILIIRGKQVLLDRELASLYGVETKALNQAVKRNSERFPERNCFKLDITEMKELVTNCDRFQTLKHSSSPSYAFTEQGVAMLSAVLHSEIAIRVSLQIMDAFVQMRHYLMDNRELVEARTTDLAMQVAQNTNDIADLRNDYQKIMDNFVDPASFKHFLILNGQKLEADIAYTQIYGMAKASILIVDNYVGVKTLDLLRGVAKNVKVTILGDQRGSCALTPQIVADFKSARPDVELVLKAANSKFHDRYILLDSGLPEEKLFHCGASSKDAGNKITTIMEIENAGMYHDVF